MYKLLAELDFRHFEATGLPVTNQEYEAYPMGPVPKALDKEITKDKDLILPEDFKSALTIEDTLFENELGKKFRGFKYIAKRDPNLNVFSPRQIDMLNDIAFIYKDSTATEASEASHEPGKPWTITVKRHGVGAMIDIVETTKLDKPLTKDIAKDMMRERQALIHNYGE